MENQVLEIEADSLEAARQADHVFATGHLLDLLDIHSVERSVFSDFYDLQRQIRLL